MGHSPNELTRPDHTDQLFTRPVALLNTIKHPALLPLHPEGELYGDEGWLSDRLKVARLAGDNTLRSTLPGPGKVGYGISG
ncbi:MAG TPA: hypothetical protein VKB96_01015 [Gammaproteobacteria bacterium]|jgi:hypothetical protein|nr:hypothetical protein [Gammaproteobacteria bacterium]